MPTYRNGELVTRANEAEMNKKYGKIPAPAPVSLGRPSISPLLSNPFNNFAAPGSKRYAQTFMSPSAQAERKQRAAESTQRSAPAAASGASASADYSAYSPTASSGYSAYAAGAAGVPGSTPKISEVYQPTPTMVDKYGDLQDAAGNYVDYDGKPYGSAISRPAANYGSLDADSASAYRKAKNEYEPGTPISTFLRDGELQFRPSQARNKQAAEDYLKWLGFTKPNPNDWTDNEVEGANTATATKNYGSGAPGSSSGYRREPNGNTVGVNYIPPTQSQQARRAQSEGIRGAPAGGYNDTYTQSFADRPTGGGFDYTPYTRPNPSAARPVQPQTAGSAYNPQAAGPSFPAVPDIGNLAYAPVDQRPPAFTASYGGIDGSVSSQPQTAMRDAFIAQANNTMMPYYANAGVYLGQGAPPPTWGQPPKFDIPQMVSNARQMADNGYTNPLAGLFGGQQSAPAVSQPSYAPQPLSGLREWRPATVAPQAPPEVAYPAAPGRRPIQWETFGPQGQVAAPQRFMAY